MNTVDKAYYSFKILSSSKETTVRILESNNSDRCKDQEVVESLVKFLCAVEKIK